MFKTASLRKVVGKIHRAIEIVLSDDGTDGVKTHGDIKQHGKRDKKQQIEVKRSASQTNAYRHSNAVQGVFVDS
ncbi:hypothetical protein VoSk93_33360 [Vibrio owensii]